MEVVGRVDTMRVLYGLVEQLRHGRGGVVHVTGEAGVGKTTVLAATHQRLGGIAVRSCASNPYDTSRARGLAGQLLPELRDGDDLVGLVVGHVERQAVQGPLALIADDVHWADPDSLDALSAVARRAADMGVLVVTSARPPGQPAYESTVDRFGVRLPLAPLTAGDTATLVTTRCGAPPGPALRTFLDEAAGNPFLITELLDALLDRGDIRTGGGIAELIVAASLPEALADRLVRRTIAAAGDDGLVARAVAVIATSLQADELAAILERPLAGVVDAILALVSSGVLVDKGDHLTFRHDLIRRAVYDATPAVVVRALNRRAVTVLGPDAAEHRVGSCLLAAADPQRRADTEKLLELGARLLEPNPLVAARLLRAGLAALDSTDPRRVPAAYQLGAALVDTGRPDEAVVVLDGCLQGIAPPQPVRVHRMRALALSMTGNFRAALGPYEQSPVPRLADALDLDEPDSADAVAELAVLFCAAGQPARAGALLAWLAEHPERLSRYGTAHEHSARAWVHAIAGRFEQAVAESGVGLDALAGDGSPAAAKARPYLVRAIMLDNCGRGEEALATLQEVQRSNAPRWNRVLAQFATTILLYRHGDWDDALAEIDAGLVAAEETRFGMAVCWPYAFATAIAAQRGDADGAARQLAAAASKVPPGSLGAELMAYAFAVTEETAGRPETAAGILAATGRAVLAVPAPGLLVNFSTDTVRLNLDRDVAVAEQVTAGLAAIAAASGSPVVAALAGWCRGLLDRNAALVARSASALAQWGRRPQAAWAWHDAATIAVRAGDHGTARAMASRAFPIYDELGAEQPHRRLRADLRDAGLSMRPRRSAARPSTGWASLTATEASVVELVAVGLTNTGIAERLFVSRRTVESHLVRVYTKLGLHSRVELVAAMRRERDRAPGRVPDPIA